MITSSNTETVSPVPKLAHEVYRDFSAVKTDKFLLKKKSIFLFLLKTLSMDKYKKCLPEAVANVYLQSMLWNKNKKKQSV